MVTVTMLGVENNTDFRGFMIQGRVVADNSHTGTFAVSGINYQAQCDSNVRQFYMSYLYSDVFVHRRQLLHMSITMINLQSLCCGLHHLLELVLSG